MGKILIDSSVIISAFREREITYQEAKNFLASGQPIIVLDYILAEIATVLKIRENRTAMKKCIDYLEEDEKIKSKVDLCLDKMEQDGTIKELFDKWV